MRLVEDDKIIAEQDAAFDFLRQPAEQRKEQRVVHNQHIRRKDAVACALEKAERMIFGEIRRVTAQLRRA